MCVCAYAAQMLAFDIETTGLDPKNSVVTVVCTECFFTGECIAYEFERVMRSRYSSRLISASGSALLG